jgi:acyl-CoA reductase-like NAD-dependent aldehyde dehydrogenase
VTERYQLFIDGRWRDAAGGATMSAINPYDQTIHGEVAIATAADVAEAGAAARRAYDTQWSRTLPGQRAALMNRLADLIDADASALALLETTDNGKVIRETSNQMGYAARLFRYYAGWADKVTGDVVPLDVADTSGMAVREPYGVIACVTAWNSPVAILCNTLPAALAAGNCVIVKPSEHASATTVAIARLCEKAGFPAGVVQVVTGGGETGAALTSSPLIDKAAPSRRLPPRT